VQKGDRISARSGQDLQRRLLKENKQNSRRFGGTGSDPYPRESAVMQMLEIEDGMLPEM
jgi:hypothetical protein